MSKDLDPRSFQADGRCYTGLPFKGATDFLSTEEEQLYLDLLWLFAQAHPEESMGEYLPSALRRALQKIHTDNFPPLKPMNYGQIQERPRNFSQAINLRFQNARNGTRKYKRMVIAEEFKHLFEGKVADSVVFVPNDSKLLEDNVRNDMLNIFVKLHKGEAEVLACHSLCHLHAHCPPRVLL